MSKELLEELSKPFPPAAIKQRTGAGNKALSYVSTDTVIRRLNACCPAWDFRIIRLEWRDDLCIAYGELTIPGLGTRGGIGVQRVSERGGEDLVKGASSDALKKSATLFGVAIDLYGNDVEAEVREAERLSDARRRFRLRGMELDYQYQNPQSVTDHIRELVPGMGLPDSDEVEAALLRLEDQHKTDSPDTPLPATVTPEEDPDPPFTGGVLLDVAPAPTATVQGGYADMEAAAARMGNPDPQGRKNARK